MVDIVVMGDRQGSFGSADRFGSIVAAYFPSSFLDVGEGFQFVRLYSLVAKKLIPLA